MQVNNRHTSIVYKHIFNVKNIRWVVLLLFLCVGLLRVSAQTGVFNQPATPAVSYAVMEKVIENGDTLFIGYIREVFIYPPLVFTSKKQEQFYWRTVRDVKKALPYARLVSSEIARVNADLFKLSTDAERKKYLKEFEKNAFRQYAGELKKLTINQGKMLMKLIDRECEVNTYDLIKAYKGNVPAFFWNAVAHLFGSSLKMDYDGADKDRIVERVVTLVDAGQL